MIYLREARFRYPEGASRYPFIPALRDARVRLDADVTILIGENGSGKSTLLEAVARMGRMPSIGEDDAAGDRTLVSLEPLIDCMTPVWSRKPRHGFFMRAEDFFGFTKRLKRLKIELGIERDTLSEVLAGSSQYARDLALGSVSGQLNEIDERYGGDLNARSHGEAFLALFRARIVPGGLYLLDEPEAPLSPIRQMALMTLIMELKDTCQFVMATHSPMLMAIPGARIVEFGEGAPREVEYDDVEHVRLMRDFLNRPEAFLRRL